MQDSITVVTDLFEHRQVKPHFINPCCFGEDFAAWLRSELQPLTGLGFEFPGIIQEDYGWGFWTHYRNDPLWIACGYVGDGPQELPAEWVVSVSYDPGLNLFKRLFHNPDARGFAQLRDCIWQILKSNSGIKVPTR